jgi:hypothetical protein
VRAVGRARGGPAESLKPATTGEIVHLRCLTLRPLCDPCPADSTKGPAAEPQVEPAPAPAPKPAAPKPATPPVAKSALLAPAGPPPKPAAPLPARLLPPGAPALPDAALRALGAFRALYTGAEAGAPAGGSEAAVEAVLRGSYAPGAVFDDNIVRVGGLLGGAWPGRERDGEGSLQRPAGHQ